MADDNKTFRQKHKSRLNIFKKTERVLCTGKPSRMQITRFFWDDVDCPDCLMKMSGVKSLIRGLLK